MEVEGLMSIYKQHKQKQTQVRVKTLASFLNLYQMTDLWSRL